MHERQRKQKRLTFVFAYMRLTLFAHAAAIFISFYFQPVEPLAINWDSIEIIFHS